MQPSPSLWQLQLHLSLPRSGCSLPSTRPANVPSSFSFVFHVAQTPTRATTTAASRAQPEPGQPHLPGGTRRAAGRGRGSTPCSAARWKGHADLRGTGAPSLHTEFSGGQFSLRCSTTFSGMCKQTVCRPVNHSPLGRFSQGWHKA